MKKLLNLVVSLVVLLIFVTIPALSNAAEIEPYVKFGTIDSKEDNHPRSTSHKAMMGVGIKVSKGKKFQQKLTAELWTMAEPTDEDREVPSDGLLLSLEGSYHFDLADNWTVYPFLGLGFEKWRRNSPLDDQDRFYGDLFFTNAIFGMGTKYKKIYMEIGSHYPFWSDTDSGQNPGGKLGFISNAGFLWGKINLGLFYSQKKFEGDGSQTDFQLEQYGASVGYMALW